MLFIPKVELDIDLIEARKKVSFSIALNYIIISYGNLIKLIGETEADRLRQIYK